MATRSKLPSMNVPPPGPKGELPEHRCTSVDKPGTGHPPHVVFGIRSRHIRWIVPRYRCPGTLPGGQP